MIGDERARRYWRSNLRYLAVLLGIWAAASFGAGIVLAPWLDQFSLGGFPLGFWFAQQGTIYVFLVLIVVYIVLMNRLDRRYQADGRAAGQAERQAPDRPEHGE